MGIIHMLHENSDRSDRTCEQLKKAVKQYRHTSFTEVGVRAISRCWCLKMAGQCACIQKEAPKH